MARIVLTDCYVAVTIGVTTTVIDDHVASITLQTTYDIVETTSFGDTAKKRLAGLADNNLSLELHQDFASGELESVIYPALGTSIAFEVRPTSAVVGASNPKYTFNAIATEWSPLNGGIGELSTISLSWPIDGVITKATS
mgnify:CR=1 FL=1|tara:strand:+ start:965 stop:1384 length:420 start_codon:yes stop_codon:yes gene_type:complete